MRGKQADEETVVMVTHPAVVATVREIEAQEEMVVMVTHPTVVATVREKRNDPG